MTDEQIKLAKAIIVELQFLTTEETELMFDSLRDELKESTNGTN